MIADCFTFWSDRGTTFFVEFEVIFAPDKLDQELEKPLVHVHYSRNGEKDN